MIFDIFRCGPTAWVQDMDTEQRIALDTVVLERGHRYIVMIGNKYSKQC